MTDRSSSNNAKNLSGYKKRLAKIIQQNIHTIADLRQSADAHRTTQEHSLISSHSFRGVCRLSIFT
jgi:hypothetical protein